MADKNKARKEVAHKTSEANRKTKLDNARVEVTNITTRQKKDWAKMLYLKENLTQKEIAIKVSATEKTIGLWIKKENWEQYKASLIVTKEEELRRIYMQINELNTHIFSREEGQRFANGKEADTLVKLTAAARSLETETSIADVIEVCMQVCDFIKKDDLQKSQEISNYFEAFIKTKL